MKVVGFLQNAWSPLYAGGTWPRQSWLKALYAPKCRTGQKLKIIEQACPELTFWWDNTTPIVGETSDSVVKPDSRHIAIVMVTQVPNYVIAFGKQAADALNNCCLPCLFLPHPAHRLVTNKLFETAAKMLNKGFEGHWILSQHNIKRIDTTNKLILTERTAA